MYDMWVNLYDIWAIIVGFGVELWALFLRHSGTTAFTFYLSPVQAAAAKAKAQFASKLKPILPTEMDLLKIEQEEINRSLRNAR